MHSTALFLSVAAATVANAQSHVYRGTTALGSPYGGNEDDQQSRRRVAYANQHPNATHSFEFSPFYLDGVFNDGQASPDTSNEWTLRINVSDFAVPDARAAFPGEQPAFVNPHITNTVMELEWHNDTTWRAALNDSAAPFCLSTTTGRFLPNVTDKLAEDNTSGDCTPVLGQACVDAILQSNSGNNCDFSSWTDLPECADTMGASATYDEYGLAQSSIDLNDISFFNNSTRDTLPSVNSSFAYEAVAHGQDGRFAIYSQSTDAYNGTNTTLYEQAATQMYVVMMNIAPFQNASTGLTYGGLWSPSLMCVRADTSKVAEDGSSGGGSGSGGGGDGDGGDGGDDNGGNDENGAVTLRSGLGAAGVAFSFGAAWLGMFTLL